LDMMIVIDFLIDPVCDYRVAKSIAHEVTVTSKYVFLNKPVAVLLSEVHEYGVVSNRIRVKAYVVDARFQSRFASDVTERVKDAFAEANIRVPPRPVLAA
ncbi:MAG: hypothetical protein KDA28_01670, partial [Phycisphaerales bacterium]|nr:hypothetical protein [Phycisphaerales bacterium]